MKSEIWRMPSGVTSEQKSGAKLGLQLQETYLYRLRKNDVVVAIRLSVCFLWWLFKSRAAVCHLQKVYGDVVSPLDPKNSVYAVSLSVVRHCRLSVANSDCHGLQFVGQHFRAQDLHPNQSAVCGMLNFVKSLSVGMKLRWSWHKL